MIVNVLNWETSKTSAQNIIDVKISRNVGYKD